MSSYKVRICVTFDDGTTAHKIFDVVAPGLAEAREIAKTAAGLALAGLDGVRDMWPAMAWEVRDGHAV